MQYGYDDYDCDDEEDGHRRTSYYNEDVVENQGAPPREDDDDDKEDDEEGEDQCAHDNDMEINEVGFSEPELLKLHREDTGDLEGKESSKDRGEEEKKDAEPFVVPTAGAFYMHDDRFRADGVTRTRYVHGSLMLFYRSYCDLSDPHFRFSTSLGNYSI